jgi:large subunit ribosomal protein L17
MKHRKTGRQFGRVRAQRKALLHALLSSLLIHGRIETTQAKAKEAKQAIDKIITKAKRAKGSSMEIVRKLQNDISAEAVDVIVQNIAVFDARESGYARVVKIAPRKSDSSSMAIVEMIDLSDKKSAKNKSAEISDSEKKAKTVKEENKTENSTA